MKCSFYMRNHQNYYRFRQRQCERPRRENPYTYTYTLRLGNSFPFPRTLIFFSIDTQTRYNGSMKNTSADISNSILVFLRVNRELNRQRADSLTCGDSFMCPCVRV